MIDNFALAVAHSLMLLGAILLLRRPDLDQEPSPHDQPVRAKKRPRGDA
jgi:hypothetical protein